MPTGHAPSIAQALADASHALTTLRAHPDLIARADTAGAALASTLRSGHKLLICGNGGSLCDAAHFAEELTGRFRQDRPALAAIACTEPGHLTCVANDFGFEQVFARWVQALGRAGDALIVLSTSGNSPNILRAVDAARQGGLTTLALLGKGGGALRGLSQHELIVPGLTSDRIQELHMLILHAWVEAIEHHLGHAPLAPTPPEI